MSVDSLVAILREREKYFEDSTKSFLKRRNAIRIFTYRVCLQGLASRPPWKQRLLLQPGCPAGEGGAAPRAGRTMGADARKVTEAPHATQPQVSVGILGCRKLASGTIGTSFLDKSHMTHPGSGNANHSVKAVTLELAPMYSLSSMAKNTLNAFPTLFVHEQPRRVVPPRTRRTQPPLGSHGPSDPGGREQIGRRQGQWWLLLHSLAGLLPLTASLDGW